MAVKFKGLDVGLVKDISLNKNNEILVKFYILRENADRIKTNSVIKIASASLMGGKFLELTEGTSNAAIAENNSFLYSMHTDRGLELLTSQISKQAKSPTDMIIANVQLLTAQLSHPKGPLIASLKNLNRITSTFAGVSGENRDQLSAMIKDLKATTANFRQMSEGMKKNPLFGGGWTDKKKKKK